MKKLFIVCLLLASCSLNSQPGTGEKIGQVVKLRRVGVMRDTWEAELIRGGMSNGSGSFGMTPFDFTIEDESQLPFIKECMEKQTEVLVRYRTEGCYSMFRSDSYGSFLVDIKSASKQ